LVKLVRTDAAGRSVILSLVAPMRPFGEGGLALREGVRLVSAEALEDSRALVWDRSAVLRDIMSHPAVSIGAVRVLLDRVASEVSRLDDSVLPDVRGRLARLLLRIAESVGRKTPRGTVINVPLSRRDLADMAITTPYTVSRILSEWRRLDILDAQRTRIIIREPERFAAIAEPQTLWSGADRRPRSLANRRRRGRHSRRIGAP
jgi:CRP-like cAMP-binding protein